MVETNPCAPGVSHEFITNLLRDKYGIEVTGIVPLAGYDDKNYHLTGLTLTGTNAYLNDASVARPVGIGARMLSPTYLSTLLHTLFPAICPTGASGAFQRVCAEDH
jgi:hypothetical protein